MARRSAVLGTAWSEVRHQPARIVATVAAIVLGIGFASGSLVFSATFQAHLERVVSAQVAVADVVVQPGDDLADPVAALAAIRAADGVALAEPVATSWLDFASAKAHGSIRVDTLPADPRLRWFGLSIGQWPTQPDEIVIDGPTAAEANLTIGSTVALTEDPSPTPTTATVVGIVDTSSSVLAGAHLQAFAQFGLLAQIQATVADTLGPLTGTVLVLADGQVSAAALAARLAGQFPELSARTGSDQAAAEVAKLDGEGDALTLVLLAFAAIALLVAAIVVANTFAILLAQRRRQIALLRCVGASRGQVRGQVLVEALLLGLVGSALGVLVGAGLGLLAAHATGLDAGGAEFDLERQPIVAAVGVLVTVLAAWWPARAAMRVAPLAALQPVAGPAQRRRSVLTRGMLGGLLMVAGLAGLGLGVAGAGLPVALAGGALSAIGVLVLTPLFVPPLLRLAGSLIRIGGVPARLAAANVDRNPGRASAAAAALMVGVGLIVTLQVGAASAAATLDREVNERFPVDIAVTATSGVVPAGLTDRMGTIDGVADVTPIAGVWATGAGLGPFGPGTSGSADGAAGDNRFPLLGVPPRAYPILRGGTELFADDTLLVPSWWTGPGALQVGQSVTVHVGSRSATFVVAVGAAAEAGPNSSAAVTTATALARLAPDAPDLALWAGLTPDADPSAVNSALNALIAPDADLELTGTAGERAATATTLGTVVTLATGMLAVAVLIAILGIGNTVALSVLERRRESALLRALGLSRRGLLRSLLLEAVLVAAAGGVVGAALGVGYGWAGTAAALGPGRGGAVLVVPWGTVAAVLVVVSLAGICAALVPARRAARVSPVTALAIT
jgi:putative ABC transport system permease protein